MTTLAVISDIHANLPALEVVLADIEAHESDHLIVAGDVINWGPFGREVMEGLMPLAPAVIRGNNEYYLLDYNTPRAPAAWADQRQWQLLSWLARTMRGRWHNLIATWPDTISLQFPDAPPVRIVHGSPRSNSEAIYPLASEELIEAMFADVKERTIIAGHTHIAMDRRIGDRHLLNPGSVGCPLQGKPEASYMILRGNVAGWSADIRTVPFDLERVLHAFRAQGFIEECGAIGELVVDEFRTSKLQVVPFLVWRQATCPHADFDHNLVERFRSIDARAYTPEPYILD